jgi:hypothetical protein
MNNGIKSPTSINDITLELDNEENNIPSEIINRDSFYEAAKVGFQIMKTKYPNKDMVSLGDTLLEIYNYSEVDPLSYTALFSLGIALLFQSKNTLNDISETTDIYEKLLTYTIQKYNEKIDELS